MEIEHIGFLLLILLEIAHTGKDAEGDGDTGHVQEKRQSRHGRAMCSSHVFELRNAAGVDEEVVMGERIHANVSTAGACIVRAADDEPAV